MNKIEMPTMKLPQEKSEETMTPEDMNRRVLALRQSGKMPKLAHFLKAINDAGEVYPIK